MSVIWRSEQALLEMRESIKEFAATSASHEELLNAALEGELPTKEVRERAWNVFIERNGLA